MMRSDRDVTEFHALDTGIQMWICGPIPTISKNFQKRCRFRRFPFVVVVEPPDSCSLFGPNGSHYPLKEKTMRVMVMVKASSESEAGKMPSTELLTAMGNFNEELVKAGVMQAGEGLHPSSRGKRVQFSGSGRTVVDGPFAETKELVAGFWLWQVKSMEEAKEWVRRCPNSFEGESEIEIRRVYALEDFGPAATPEILEREERLRTEVDRYALESPRFENGRELRIA